MTDDELFSSFKASGRFAAVLPGDRASGLRLSSPTQTLRPVTKTPSLAGVWIRVSVTVPVPQTEHSWSHVLFPVLDSWAKNPTGLTGGTCEMFQWKQDSTLPCFGLGANGIFLTNWPSKLFLMFKAAGEKIISPYSYPSDNTKIQHLPQFPNNCPELFKRSARWCSVCPVTSLTEVSPSSLQFCCVFVHINISGYLCQLHSSCFKIVAGTAGFLMVSQVSLNSSRKFPGFFRLSQCLKQICHALFSGKFLARVLIQEDGIILLKIIWHLDPALGVITSEFLLE